MGGADYPKMALVRWDPAGELLPQIPFPHPPAMGGGRHQIVTADGFLVATGRSIADERVNRLIAVAGGWAETVPAIANLALAADGRLWVQRRVPGEENPPIDLFDPDGAYAGTLEVTMREVDGAWPPEEPIWRPNTDD